MSKSPDHVVGKRSPSMRGLNPLVRTELVSESSESGRTVWRHRIGQDHSCRLRPVCEHILRDVQRLDDWEAGRHRCDRQLGRRDLQGLWVLNERARGNELLDCKAVSYGYNTSAIWIESDSPAAAPLPPNRL